MSRGKVLRSVSNHKWRHSAYVTELHNVYVKSNKPSITTELGTPNANHFRNRIEFYSRLCGKVIQHLEKQNEASLSGHKENSKWTYSGLFFPVVHNLNEIHQKDLIILMVALVKLLRAARRGMEDANCLKRTVESFMASLLICGDQMIKYVKDIANGIEPTMNKWKYFSNLMHTLAAKYHNYEKHGSTDGEQDAGRLQQKRNHASENKISQYYTEAAECDVITCLAGDPSQSLFARIIQRSTKPKDFARLSSVLYWLHHLGFPPDTMQSFFSLLLHRMLECPFMSGKNIYPRDIISVLRYSLPFERNEHEIATLYSWLSACNREYMLRMNLQDINSLLEYLLGAEHIEQGLLLSLLTNLQVCVITNNYASKNTANILHAYLSEKKGAKEEYKHDWNNTLIEFPTLDKLIDKYIAKGALVQFLQTHTGEHCNGPNKDPAKVVDDARLWSSIVTKLNKLCVHLEDTRFYCVAVIEYLETQKKLAIATDGLTSGTHQP